MALIQLAIPPGVYKNGTEFQSAGRWYDASLVRWTEGTIRPVGGWLMRGTITDKPIRGALAWQDLAGDRWLAAGTYEKLFAISASGTVTDITPAGFTAGSATSTVNTGYGGGFYGVGTYGTVRVASTTYDEATTWSLDNWGEYLVACSPDDGKLYEWQLNTANDAVAITNAPTSCLGLVVTAERVLFALGASGNPRLVKWSDVEDNTVWTAAATNEAGEFELQTSGQIMAGVRTRGQTLVITDLDAHAATYLGPPFVYGFDRVGSACGLVSRKAVAVVDAGAFWMGQRSFFRYAGNVVEDIPCEVSDYVFTEMNRAQQSLIFAVPNAQYGEIWWFYPAADGTECSRYVVYNYKENHWAVGSLARTCGIDRGVFRNPIWFSPAGIAYNHETGDARDGDVFAQSGPVSLGAGDQVMNVMELIPDEKTQGSVTATFKARFHPNDTEREYGPYDMANPTNVRFAGRQVSMRIEEATASDWRVGVQRVEVIPGGRR